jgi:hypothetical protein
VSHEPGVNLGRMIAAERNAMAGVELAKAAMRRVSDADIRIAALENHIVFLTNELQQVRTLAAIRAGNGPTAGG